MSKNCTRKIAPPKLDDFGGAMSEFGRWQDVRRQFGLKRGFLYGLLADGKVRGVLVRGKGKTSGCRLFHLGSVRDFIETQMPVEVQRTAPLRDLKVEAK